MMAKTILLDVIMERPSGASYIPPWIINLGQLKLKPKSKMACHSSFLFSFHCEQWTCGISASKADPFCLIYICSYKSCFSGQLNYCRMRAELFRHLLHKFVPCITKTAQVVRTPGCNFLMMCHSERIYSPV